MTDAWPRKSNLGGLWLVVLTDDDGHALASRVTANSPREAVDYLLASNGVTSEADWTHALVLVGSLGETCRVGRFKIQRVTRWEASAA